MPKRSAQEKLDSYKRKIRKIEEREKRKKETSRRRIRRLLDSSEDENNEDTNYMESRDATEPQMGLLTPQDDVMAAPVSEVLDVVTSEQGSAEPVTEPTSEVALDPELLFALGASTSDTPEFGNNIHDSLSNLWTPILKKGLPREDKDKLTKEYLLPSNCKMLQAPKLNAEISAAVAEVVRGRDKKLVRFQQQLGIGTAAISRGIDTLLTSNDKIVALKQLSDGCRFLTDLHHLLSKDRIKLVTPSLEKNFLTVIQDAERDETLFGSSLSEKIKASQAISRQSSQIKASTNQKAAGSVGSTQSSANRPVPGNWSGPPRYPSNRGGRGGQRRPAASTPRRTYPLNQAQAKTFNHQPKTRATAQ
ncbi:uncharacterized protein LOC126372519 [Pectinophora gossypiella]|uniref:uncharacterized protein LOC126372519 n=1 Tax=Pectinophora gossypiella TaxID=13191 RepID=UPI00214EAE25|nr:uncharacterized protein LOC126372519 [Pectinophora gossypiella]